LLNSNLVRVCIEELLVNAYLGVHAAEQEKRRSVPVYLEFEYEQPPDDSLAAAVDYRKIRDRVMAAIENQRFCLVETMARKILDAVRGDPRISRVFVKVSKTKALSQAASVSAAVEWTRARQ
jgi:FolB domain-containing protein